MITVFWFRRDLRLNDNTGLIKALNRALPVLPIFIFDTQITDELLETDARISFIYKQLNSINASLKEKFSGVKILKGEPLTIFKKLVQHYKIANVYTNTDYEPYAIKRDSEIQSFLEQKGIVFKTFKDQVIFEKNEVLKADGNPYTVFTPYKNKWLSKFSETKLNNFSKDEVANQGNYFSFNEEFPSLESLGFKQSEIDVSPYNLSQLNDYSENRDIPARDATSFLSTHLRFGAVSIRQIVKQVLSNETFLSELIWREFFMQILYHFPRVVTENFKQKYNSIKWRNNEKEFTLWTQGKTGYPLVDAGIHQLNETGYMHNRVRMVVASFLCKHLLIDWRWGEAYFAEKLLDYEQSSNNGNWQWAAGTGCDAAPYFRVFNPIAQQQKFDPNFEYIKKWIPEFDPNNYLAPIVDHAEARKRAIETYKKGLELINNP